MNRREAVALVRALPGRLARSDRVAAAVAEELAELCRANFEVLSRGGTGADGTKWKPLTAATVRRKGSDVIGVHLGAMRAAIGPESEPGVISVTAPTDHTAAFDAVRPLFPAEVPESWWPRLKEAATGAAAEEARAALAGN